MKHLALVCLVLVCSNVTADEGNILFRSKAGFEVEVPKCWKPAVDNPDHDGPVESSPDVFFREGKDCPRPRLSVNSPNGIGIYSSANFKTREEMTKAISVRSVAIAGDKSFPKHNKKNGTIEFEYVESLPRNGRRWTKEIFCPNLIFLRVVGPAIDNVDEKTLAKIKQGDLSAPEPEGTIMRSVKCGSLQKSK